MGRNSKGKGEGVAALPNRVSAKKSLKNSIWRFIINKSYINRQNYTIINPPGDLCVKGGIYEDCWEKT